MYFKRFKPKSNTYKEITNYNNKFISKETKFCILKTILHSELLGSSMGQQNKPLFYLSSVLCSLQPQICCYSTPWDTLSTPPYLCLVFHQNSAHLPLSQESLLWLPSAVKLLSRYHSTASPLFITLTTVVVIRILSLFPLDCNTQEDRIHFCFYFPLNPQFQVEFFYI